MENQQEEDGELNFLLLIPNLYIGIYIIYIYIIILSFIFNQLLNEISQMEKIFIW